MSDIVEQLRQASLSQSDYRWEAADEIERLRKDLSLVAWADNEHVKGLEKENERLRSEIERLRKALLKIAIVALEEEGDE